MPPSFELPLDPASFDAPPPGWVDAPIRRGLRYWLLGWIERHRIIHVPEEPDWVLTRLRHGTGPPHPPLRKRVRGPQKSTRFGRDVRWQGELGEQSFRLVYSPPESRFVTGYSTRLIGRVTARPSGAAIRVRIQPHWLETLGIPLGCVALCWLWELAESAIKGEPQNFLGIATFVVAPTLALFVAVAWRDVRRTERELHRVQGLPPTGGPLPPAPFATPEP